MTTRLDPDEAHSDDHFALCPGDYVQQAFDFGADDLSDEHTRIGDTLYTDVER